MSSEVQLDFSLAVLHLNKIKFSVTNLILYSSGICICAVLMPTRLVLRLVLLFGSYRLRILIMSRHTLVLIITWSRLRRPWLQLYVHVSAVASWSAEPAKQKKKKKTKCAQDAALSPSWLKDSWKVSVLLCTWNHHHAELRREPIKTRIFSQWSRHYKIIGYKGFFFLCPSPF